TAYDKRRIYQIPAGVIRPGELNVIVAQVQGLSVDLWGMDQYRTAIGPAMTIFSSEINESFRALLFLTCYTTVGLYFFFMWARRRQDKQNLFFAVFCVLLIAYNLLRSQLRYDRGISFLELKRLEYIALYAVVPFFFLFFRSYFHLPKTKVVKVFDGLMTLVCVVLLAGIGHTLVTNDTDGWWKFQRTIVQLGCWPPLVVGSVGILVYRMFKKDKDALAMFISMILLVAAMVLDIASSMGKVNFPAIFQYVFIAFILSIGTVLSNRFLRLHREIEDLNANLEQKIETRTRELNQTVAKARAIKEQQDGDYFLTSLLIEPLSGVFSTGGPVHAESFVRQKKEFEFRKWKSDLGGDLAIVDRIGLRDKDFTVFINADAMGKSMQGAGGAVVLGTTFQSLISRTKRGINASRHPEQWLRDAFFDLQNVFVAFDGSMLVSAIFGLIDEASGTLYYINSEHPGAVLYRDKKAQFLTDAGLIRKFGIEGIEENLHVNMLRLKPDDVVILGSDGRDDLHIGEDPQGGRIINDDESLFLRIVEEAQGNLNEIVEGLTTRGQIIDDLSLIRLGYREDAPAIQTAVLPGGYESLLSAGKAAFARKDSAEARTRLEGALKLHESEEVYEMLVRCCLAQKDFRAAADLVDQATLLYPANHRLLYLALRAFKGTGQYDRAVEYGERAALRDPDNTDNLMHLADCYRLLKKSSRAQDAIRRAEKKQASPDLMRKLKGLLGVAVLAIALTPSLRAESPIQLETSRDQQWQITSDEIDPEAETRAFFSEARTSDQTVVWLPVQVPGERRGAKPGTIWLRTTLNLKEKPTSSLAFRAGIIRDRDRVFINGNLIGSTGEWDASAPQAFDRSRLYEVKPDVFRTGDNLILIQIQGTPELPPAIRFGPLSLGTIQDALTRQASTAYMHGALTVVYLTIASYFLFLFLKRSEERDNLYFGLFTILVAIFTFLQSELKYQIQLSFMTFKKIELIAQFASVPAYFAFIQAFFPERRERDRGVLKVIGLSGYGIIALACILVAATSNLSIWIFVRNYGVTTGCILLVVGGAGLVYNRLRAFERDAFYFTGGLIVLAGGIIFAYLSETGILHLPNVLDGFLLIFVIINAMTLA
ncbi:MAG TPA: 7TM diverse intracellular signaling domain-containing protein, partial [Leptospiraceae bacterium]|nr:7TM diverse intracellular signaling domain-containing protein [Leptospiraceae bacterium]